MSLDKLKALSKDLAPTGLLIVAVLYLSFQFVSMQGNGVPVDKVISLMDEMQKTNAASIRIQENTARILEGIAGDVAGMKIKINKAVENQVTRQDLEDTEKKILDRIRNQSLNNP